MRKAASFWAALFLGGIAMAADFTGTWKLSLEKSSPDTSKIAYETIKLEQTGPNAYRTTHDVVLKSGSKTHHEMNRIYDGQERTVPGDGLAPQGTEICEITGPGDRKITFRKDGKVVEVLTSSVSKDGKTLTNTITTDKGRYVSVYDKQ
jgi:hypothetical protein